MRAGRQLVGLLLASALIAAPLLSAEAMFGAPAPATPNNPDLNAMPLSRYQEAKALAQPQPPKVYSGFDKKNLPVHLIADMVEHDGDKQTLTASGHVELDQAGHILRADKVTYDLNSDIGYADGNVIISEPNGDVHFADSIQFAHQFGSGFTKGLQSYLANGGRFIARDGKREGTVTTMNHASYTPCECEEESNHKPGWMIKAKQMIYHADEHKVVAHDAQFNVYGVPVFWTPYMSVPDGKVKQQSGFLPPTYGYHSNLGATISDNYYWAIGPDRDATIGTLVTTQRAPVAEAGYRERFDNGQLRLNGSTTYSNRPGIDDNDHGGSDDQWRGHLFGDGLWDINDKWRAGANLQLTSDDQYLREYGISHQDVLQNQIYAERFSGRDYFQTRVIAFQDTRVIQDRVDQPNVLPEVEWDLMGDPNGVLGGRWNLDLSALGLQRKGNGQDLDRFVANGGWQSRYVTDFGLVNTVQTGLRGDAYYVDDHDPNAVQAGQKATGVKSRIFPFAQVMSAYPLAKPLEKMQAVVTPLAALTVAPTNHVNNREIPNEDSQAAELTAQNLFDPDRFPGLDRIEDGSRATYGLRNGLYGYGGSYGDVFLGQSTRLNNNDNGFPQGSGLSNQTSDLVGQVTGVYNRQYGVSYGFELNSHTFSPERHEVSGFANFERFRFNTRYIYTKALQNSDIEQSRAQAENNISYDLTHQWRVRAGAINDFGQDPGLRRAVLGLDYFGCCLSFSLTAERNLTTNNSGDNGTSVNFRIGLKGLGGFETPEQVDNQNDGLWR